MMDNNSEILEALEQVVAILKKKKADGRKFSQHHKIDKERSNEIYRLRLEEGWTLQKIGDKYGISRERVRQIIGNTGYISVAKTKERTEYIKSQTDKTNGELAIELGVGKNTISIARGDIRHAIEFGIPGKETGFIWEEWSYKYLLKNKIENELQNFNAPYDIIALGNVFIDVKVATKTRRNIPGIKSPQYQFNPNPRHNKADIYMLIIAPSEDVFIVPANRIENMGSVSFCWPTRRPEIGKIQQYHNRLDLIWKVHKERG